LNEVAKIVPNTLLSYRRQLEFSAYDMVREQKLREFDAMQQYALQKDCYMGYLTAYLGDQLGYVCGTCGQCMPTNFPLIQPAQRTRDAVARFLNKEWLPRIEKRRIGGSPAHEMGWSLSYHGNSTTGQLVRASKYEEAGAFATQLVTGAIDVTGTRYPVGMIDAIVSVPSTRSGSLVEDFAKQVASELKIVYLPALIKIRTTREQKELSNRVQKEDNVKGAFQVQPPDAVAGRTLLLIDDIYDSGYTMRETGHTLMKAGATMVYPFTITHTAHSDEQ
jgi:ATP-dependent DNA helicase RecQ